MHIAGVEERSRFTELFEAYAIRGLQTGRSKVQVQDLGALSWDRIMGRAVARGFERRTLQGLSYAGLDKKSFGRGPPLYVSVLHDISGRQGPGVVPARTREATESSVGHAGRGATGVHRGGGV